MPVPLDIRIGGREERPPLPEDVYQCEILDVTLHEKPKYQRPDETEQVFTFKFGVLDAGYRGRWLFKDMRPLLSRATSTNSASNLYEFFVAITGRELTDEEVKSIDAEAINALIGRQVRLTVKITPKGRNKVEGALKAKTILPTLPIHVAEEASPAPERDLPF